MGEKRPYKLRKPGGCRKKLKQEFDAGKNLKEQMERAVDRPPGKQQKSGVELGASGTEEY